MPVVAVIPAAPEVHVVSIAVVIKHVFGVNKYIYMVLILLQACDTSFVSSFTGLQYLLQAQDIT